MLIDWFTVGAQLLNFLVLVWLLKRYLYKPILTAIDAREKRVADQLSDAAANKVAAQKEYDDLQGKNKAFDDQRTALLAKAAADADVEHDRLLEAAHKAADNLRVRQAAALQSDQTRLGSEIAKLAGDEVFAIARKTLADLASASLEERMTDVFVRRLHDIEVKTKAAFAEALRTSSEPATVRSTFELPAEQRKAIQKALEETFSTAIRLNFEIAAEGLAGIELTSGGQKLAWSIADYLAAMQREVSRLLDSPQTPAATLAPRSDATTQPPKATVVVAETT